MSFNKTVAVLKLTEHASFFYESSRQLDEAILTQLR